MNKVRSPEQRELENKLAKLTSLEKKLANYELELTTVRIELNLFD